MNRVKWAGAHKTPAKSLRAHYVSRIANISSLKSQKMPANFFAGIFEDLESRSINRRSLACQIERTLRSTICSGDTGGLTTYKIPDLFFGPVSCFC